MEEVLGVYERPLQVKEPVVCLDERPVQLLSEVRAVKEGRPGRIRKRDNEYKREGVVNVFCAVEPKAGRHLTRVTPNRKGPEFAKMMKRIERSYPQVRTIHLVMDNLNTHTEKSLTDYYGLEAGKRLWERFTVHYTPKHGSWLNQAEIEISLFSRQCLGKDRIGDIGLLRQRTMAWNKAINRKKTKINWTFTQRKARKKFKYDSTKNIVLKH